MAGYLLGAALPLLALRDFWGVAPGVDVEMRGRVVKYAKFRWISEIAGVFVFSRIEVLFVQIFWGVESVGLLTASLTLANLAVQGPLMLTWGVLPHLTDQFNRKEMEGLRASYCAGTRLMGFLIFPACFGLAALVPELLPRLYGSSFERAVPSAVILVCAASISATATIGANVLWAVERTDVDLYLSAIGAALSVAGGFLLIAPLGIVGAALSRAIAQFVVIGAGLWFLHARLGFQIPLAALGKLSVASLLCSATAYVVLLFVHGYPGMTLAIGAGAFVYLAAVRLLKALEPSDLESLRGLAQYLPSSFWGSAALKVMTFALG
jgi:O-antigen/teichoic acid export membrane protein